MWAHGHMGTWKDIHLTKKRSDDHQDSLDVQHGKPLVQVDERGCTTIGEEAKNLMGW